MIRKLFFFVTALAGFVFMAAAVVCLVTGNAAPALTFALAGLIPSSIAFHIMD